MKKEALNRLERHLLQRGGVAKLSPQFGRATPWPTAMQRANTQRALALKPNTDYQPESLRALRGLLQTPRYPGKEQLARTRGINEATLIPRLRELGGKQYNARYWKDVDPTFWYDEAKTLATPGEYRAKSLRIGEETERPNALRTEHILRAGAAKAPIETKLSPAAGQLVLYPDALQVQRERLTKQRTTTPRPADPTDMRQTLEHEGAERKLVLDAIRKGQPTTPYSSHWGSGADVAANTIAAKDPASQWTPNNPDSFIETKHWDRLYKQHGGTRGSPIAPDSRAARSLDRSIARVMARAPITPETRPDLTAALDAAIAGVPLHPELEQRLLRDFALLKPELAMSPLRSDDAAQQALEVLRARTRLKTSEEEEETPWYRRPSTLIPAAAAAAGLGAYGYMRAPSFSQHPALRALQEKAQQGGFRRVVDLTPHLTPQDLAANKAVKVLPELWQSIKNRQITQPLSQKFRDAFDLQLAPGTTNLTPAQRLLFHLREGGGAIPITAEGGKVRVMGHEGQYNVPENAVLSGRHQMSPESSTRFSAVIRGGHDIEGPQAVQKAMTHMATKGKGMEADILQKYSPGAIPTSITDLSPWFASPDLPTDRVQRAEMIRKKMTKDLGKDMPIFALKPTQGLQSGGDLPVSSESWGKALNRYDTMMAQPENKVKLDNLLNSDPAAAVRFLRSNGLLEGHTISEAMADPSSALAQHWLPGGTREWRVHTMGGEVPKRLIGLRDSWSSKIERDAMLSAMVGKGKMAPEVENVRAHVQKILDDLPPEYAQGAYGADVMTFTDPKTKELTHKLMELNPAEQAGLYGSGGGGSGFLDTRINPWTGQAEIRSATGRWSKPVAGAAGLLAAGGAGALAAGGVGAANLGSHFLLSGKKSPPEESEGAEDPEVVKG